jgi:zinc and cadmium transporter
VGEHQGDLVGCALAFSAGVFLCISLGDLLPELHFHTHDRVKLSAALLLGITISYALGYLEPHPHELPSPSAPHDHQGHVHNP